MLAEAKSLLASSFLGGVKPVEGTGSCGMDEMVKADVEEQLVTVSVVPVDEEGD